MASLNTLRTKGGVIVTIVIFLALIAFIVGDLFSRGTSPFNSGKTRVGVISGHKVDYIEFLNQSDYVSNIHQMMWGRESSTAQEQERIYNEAWERLIMEYSYGPSFESMGLKVAGEELLDMVDGTYMSPVILQTFMNPNTGMFDREILENFLANASENDNAYAIWAYMKEQMVNNRMMNKFYSLVNSGFFVTDLEVANATKAAGEKYDIAYISKPLYSVPDSLVNITDSQIKKYYDSHKEMFKQGTSRDVEYVVFDVMPSEADYAAAEKIISEMAAEFAVAELPMQYASLNSHDKTDMHYYKESELGHELAALLSGNDVMHGPVLDGDTYTMSRIADTRMLPDSLGARHILLNKTDRKLADSLVNVIRKGSDFATLAREFSIDQSAQVNGGDLGRFVPEQMVAEFSDAAIKASKGEIFTVESPYGLHVVELTYKSVPVKKTQIATVVYKIDPSAATMQEIFSNANNFVTAAGATAEEFRQAVSDLGLSKRTVRIKNTDRNISGLKDSRELVRWAYTNKKGSVSPIMQIDGDYMIAAITDVKEEGYMTVEQAKDQIMPVLINKEKGKIIAAQMTGESLENIAANNDIEVKTANDIHFNAFYIPEIGVEPALIGAVSALPQGAISKPVVGSGNVYVFQITGINADEEVTAESERARLEANSEFYLMERTMQALSEGSEVKDMRVKFF